jgi:pSer/pThr/pTyr-binding forkhead associated (FHA) protein
MTEGGLPAVAVWILSGFDSGGKVMRLTLSNRSDEHTVLPERRLVLGRHSQDCDLIIDDSGISRRHAEFVIKPDGAWLRDLGSANGTLLDGKSLAVNRYVELPDTAALTLGDLDLTIFKVSTLEATRPARRDQVADINPPRQARKAKSTLFFLAATPLVAAVVWVGAAAVGAGKAENGIQQLAATSTKYDNSPHIANLRHQRGLLKSTGSLDFCATPDCGENGETKNLHVTYTMHHLPMPSAAMRFDWVAEPRNELAQFFKSNLTGSGVGTFGRNVETTVTIPAGALDDSESSLTVSPSSGTLKVDIGDRVEAHWNLDKISLSAEGQAAEFKNTAIDYILNDPVLRLGAATLIIEQINTTGGTAEAIKFAFASTLQNQRQSYQTSVSLRRAQVENFALKDVAIEVDISGMDPRSLMALAHSMSDNTDPQNLTAEEALKLRNALGTLLRKGLTLNVSKVAGTLEDPSGKDRHLTANLSINLMPGFEDQQVAIISEKQLRSTGSIQVTGEAVTDDEKQKAVASGYAVPLQDGFKADFTLDRETVLVNGKPPDSAEIKERLKDLDNVLNLALSPAAVSPN